MDIAENTVVSFDYTLQNDAGETLDSSDGREPLAYLHGHGNIVPGLEKAMTGKAVGDSFKATVSPEEGYGNRHAALEQEVPRSAFEGIDHIEPGMMFQAETPNGPAPVTVTAVAEDTVTVDGNHALAGQTLHFDVTVREIREASAEEIEHGHVHGPNGHPH